MRLRYQILLPLLGLFFVRVDLTDLFPIYLEVDVLKVYDGDTLLVSHGSYKMKVRLSKIDAPEKKQFFFDSIKDAGVASKECLKAQLGPSPYILKIEKEDIYSRILGDINNLSLKLITNGCACLYPYAQFNSRREKSIFLKQLLFAKKKQLGLWKYGGYVTPMRWRKFSKQTLRRQ